ncbi:hypothetical protein [Variovorax sp. PBL-E5]|uniref:hypothetical protein n=1 Tax=Variovorax sp. PBL-E5 TaxID=434014 RepID=UPI001318661F|nr:hypothetical protein [Variovorax sp. PBL-E5]VTU37077.1 hypothetical protein E5CHR_04478 [Variovorax sp. PBL-E5]
MNDDTVLLIISLVLLGISCLPLLCIFCDDRRTSRAYAEYFRQEEARKATRTPEQKRADKMCACLLVAGFIPQALLEEQS